MQYGNSLCSKENRVEKIVTSLKWETMPGQILLPAKPLASHDQVVKGEHDEALFRIRRQMKTIALLIDVERVTANILDQIKLAMVDILQGSRVHDGGRNIAPGATPTFNGAGGQLGADACTRSIHGSGQQLREAAGRKRRLSRVANRRVAESGRGTPALIDQADYPGRLAVPRKESADSSL